MTKLKNIKEPISRWNFTENNQGGKSKNNKPIKWKSPSSFNATKSPKWYLALVGATILISAVFYLITRDYITVGILLFCSAILAYYGNKPPRIIAYEMSSEGVKIGQKQYYFSNFRTIFLIKRTDGSSLSLIPNKRFSPALNISFRKEDEERVMGFIGEIMPVVVREDDIFDKILQFIGI